MYGWYTPPSTRLLQGAHRPAYWPVRGHRAEEAAQPMSMSTRPPPPGPKGHFLLGNLPEFSKDLLGFITQCAREYGDIVRLRLANRVAYLLNHPDYIEYVLVTNHRNFVKNSFFWRHVKAVFGSGLLTSEGDFWLRERRLCQPAFHREQIAGYGQVMVNLTAQILADWHDGEVRDVHQDMMRLTSRIASRTLFGTDVGAEVEQIEPAVNVVIKEIAVRFRRPFPIPDSVPTPRNLRYRAAIKRLDDLIYRVIRERRAAAGAGGERGDDLMSLLLHAQDIDGTRMTDRQLRDEAMTLFIAGHETTALALSWTWYLLSQHPDIEAKLWAELQTVLGGRPPGVADLARLTYTERVVMESLRLYPPAYGFGREALQDCEIGGYSVPKGTTLFMSQWVMHRSSRYFPDPEAFLPDRWADGLAKRLPRYAYCPFGGGPRTCIGSGFAMMEAVLLLATIAQKFRLTLVPGHPIVLYPSLTLRPAHGVRVVLERRR